MSKNIRIKTEVGKDRNLKVKIDQDFDFLEILSLKIRQEDVYTRFCSDYGIVTGRVVANGGFGLPNVNVSVFIPLDDLDENDPVISTLYPYKTPQDKNEDGYRYNLLPYVRENFAHVPTGTFPDRKDVLTRREVLEVYEKYYKYTVKTNSSGDFMIVGVPLGQQKVVMDCDLSNIGEFSLRPADFIRSGVAVETQFDGQSFRSSENIDSLPQIVHDVVDVDVSSFWGENESCDVGITRVDFDLRELGVDIQPSAVFMGSMFSTDDSDFLKSNCKPKPNTGNLCSLVTSPGQILSIRQTIDTDVNDDPILEEYRLENNGNLIDENGTWMVDLPMNLDYLTTNEFGETIISNDPSVGIPTKGKYRFKIKWQAEAGLNNSVLRANYLVPNIREHWLNSSTRPQDEFTNKSYAFSLDWDDYFDKESAIKCEDTFYHFSYNKVYTVSSHIDRFKFGSNRSRHLGIKEINDRDCQSEINKLPVNDGVRNFDFLFFIFSLFLLVMTRIIGALLPLIHILAFLWPLLRIVFEILRWVINGLILVICFIVAALSSKLTTDDCKEKLIPKIPPDNPFRGITLPSMSYPDCEACNCNDNQTLEVDTSSEAYQTAVASLAEITNVSSLADINDNDSYTVDCRYNSDGVLLSNILDYYNPELDSPKEQCWSGNLIESNITGLPYQGIPASFNRWFLSPVYPQKRFDWAVDANGQVTEDGCVQLKERWLAGTQPTFPQTMNLLNQRSRYFKRNSPGRQNIIEGKLQNDQFAGQTTVGDIIPNQPWTDLPLIIMTDGNINYNSGQLLTFSDPTISAGDTQLMNKYSGGTNGFGRNGKTGGTVYNENSYVQRQVKYIDESGNEQTSSLRFFNTASTTDYKFTCGVEYFQVITGYTMTELSDIFSNQISTTERDRSILWTHIFASSNTVVCNLFNSPPQEWDQNQCDFGGIIMSFANQFNNYLNVKNRDAFDGFENLKIYILTRGVDPHSPRQKIKYQLGKLFGKGTFDTVFGRIQGDFYMNIPIQAHGNEHESIQNFRSPISLYQYTSYNNNNGGGIFSSVNAGLGTANSNDNNPQMAGYGCYHQSFTFPLTFDEDEVFSTTGLTHYSAMSKELGPDIGKNFSVYSTYGNNSLVVNGYNDRLVNGDNGNIWINTLGGAQTGFQQPLSNDNYLGRVEGASMQFSKRYIYPQNEGEQYLFQWGVCTDISDAGTISPGYERWDGIPFTNMYNLRVFRTDRLPTSDSNIFGTDGTTRYNQKWCLHLNPNFRIYELDEIGNVTSTTGGGIGFQPTDSSGNAADMADELPSSVSTILDTFTCEGMVSLKCYEGTGEDFGVITPCIVDDFDYGSRVVNGCYLFVEPPYIGTIFKDYILLAEWKSRIRLTFGMCRGVLSEVFQNNWLNGSLYMPSFQKKSIYNSDNELVTYKYCGYLPPNDGPLYFNTETNSFFYRSTPYFNNQFVGQTPSVTDFGGQNEKNIWFPTTIMDLGPREELLKEVIFSPEFQSFSLDKIKSTSYQDTSDIINLFLISRLVNSTFLQQALGSGDASINQLFSRDPGGAFSFKEDRVDGDIAQLMSINSEFGVIPYFGGNYDDSITVNDDRLGIWFESNLIDRIVLNPGVTTFGNDPVNSPSNLFGYPSSQIVPYYKWEIKNNGLFGTEKNTWKTNQIYSTNYQNSPLDSSGYVVPQYGPAYGYIFNASNSDPELDQFPGSNLSVKVGSPYHFYFGLKKGKSAMNRFITRYLFTEV